MLPVSDFNYTRRTVNKKPDFFGRAKLKVVVTLAVALTLLFGAQIVFASNLVTGGQKLYSIQKEITTIEQENMNLKAQIAQVSSFSKLSQKAQSMGFAAPSNIMSP